MEILAAIGLIAITALAILFILLIGWGVITAWSNESTVSELKADHAKLNRRVAELEEYLCGDNPDD